ncbi:MAG TPA: hypothetical protein VKR55_21040 [Bradyrhizobium sp.]|uniref:hypothetical protein n=1 Tax=Bradyrhizobium sp. TaxID=376 RepID=UPI002C84FFFA|nr:hypothetical protein [Bradyrhizobium sp.]HLZ04618.1 hypothetical protein [Bradyrhizobium sp.]
MNHSMYSADRTTHLKIVVAALIAAIAMTSIALSSHLTQNISAVAVVKAGKPVVMTNAAIALTR